ncbi:MAG: flagellar biosynthesis protein FlhF, partial [Planctomycetota bacterium]
MNAKTYWAKTMGEALTEVKRDLGRQAVILHTRRVRRGGFLRLFGRQKLWEVTASPNANVPPRATEGEYVPEPTPRAATEASGQADDAAFDELIEAVIGEAPAIPAPRAAEQDLAHEVSSLRHLIEAIAARTVAGSVPAPTATPIAQATGVYARIRERLIEQDVEVPIADELIRQVREEFGASESVDDAAVTGRMRSLIARCIVVGPPAQTREGSGKGRARVVVLIGPTGVGKTTTIAKLAAAAALRQRLKVALVTMDTYRIAAVEQLRTYAEIIGVPLHAVLTPEELRETVESLRDHDLVLIDTAGRSQNDRVRLNHLGKFVQAARADEVHLVIAATASSRCARQVMTNFAPLGANRVILTKLDEADSLGVVLNVSAAAGV